MFSMQISVLFVLLAMACVAIDGQMIKRVINGENAPPDKYPWAVSIKASVPGTMSTTFCGATLIAKQWLVTAAHCFFVNVNGDTMKLDDPSVWHLQAGNVLIDRSYEKHSGLESDDNSKEEGSKEEGPKEEGPKEESVPPTEEGPQKEESEPENSWSEFEEPVEKGNRCPDKKPDFEDCNIRLSFSYDVNTLYSLIKRKSQCMQERAYYEIQMMECKVERQPRWWEKYLGRDKRSAEQSIDKRGQRRHLHIAQVIVHPKYSNQRIEWDIALIKLSKPLDVEDIPEISLVNLPEANIGISWPPRDAICVMVGWGCTKAGGQPNARAQLARLEVMSNYRCNIYYRNSADLNNEHEFCAGFYNKGIGICPGDSGSGLVCKAKDDVWTVAGVASATHSAKPGQFPGLFTRVSYFRKWIDENLEI